MKCAVLLFLGGPGIVAAQETVIHRFEAERPDEELEDVLYLAAGVELTQAGLSSRRSEGDAEYTLYTEYDPRSDEVIVAYTLTDSSSPRRPLSETRAALPLDHDVDARVARAIRTLLRQAGIEPSPSPQATIEGLFPDGPRSDAAEKRPGAEQPPTPSPGAPNETPPALPSRAPPADEPAPAGEEDGEEDGAGGFVFTAATGPAMIFGELSRYVHYGATGSITAAYSRTTNRRSFRAGGTLGMMRGFNDADITGGPLYVSTAGVTAGIGTGTDAPYRLSGEVCGGAAFITVASSRDTVTRAAPYAGVGVHPGVPLGERFYFAVAARFLVIFDREFPIPIAISSIAVSMEL